MAMEYAKSFYKSRTWQQCREAYIAIRMGIDGGMCEDCHEHPGYIVHHKKHITPDNISNPEITLSFSNLRYVCQDCHNKEHGRAEKEKPRYIFSDDGDVLPAKTPPLK